MVCPIALGDHNKAQTCTQGTQNCTSLITLKTNLNKFAILWYQQNIVHWLWSPYVIGQTIIFSSCSFFMVALCNRADHYIFALQFLSFFFYIFFFISSPNLSGRRSDVCHTLTHGSHGVALVRIQNAGLKGAAHGSLQMQDPKSRQKSPSRHHRTTLSGHIFASKAYIDNRKKN